MEEPPDDAEDWSDEEWIAWLAAHEVPEGESLRVYAPRLDTAGGAVLGAAMLGLQRAMFGAIDAPKIVIEAAGKDHDDGPKVDLDEDDPSASTVVLPPRPDAD